VSLSVGAARAEPCGLKLLATLPMQDDGDGRLVVPVTVGGTTQRMIVDTGGFVSMLTKDTVETLKLPKFEMSGMAYSLNGSMTHFTKASLDIGPLHAAATQFIVMDAMPGWARLGISGTLGQDVQQGFDFDFDFAARKVNIMLQDHCAGQVVYWTKAYAVIPFETVDSGHIKIPVTLDGKTLNAEVDTGSTGSFLSTTAAHREFGLEGGADGDTPAKFHLLTIGAVSVQNPTLYLVEDKIHDRAVADFAMSGDIGARLPRLPDLTVGNDILRRLHLYIAYKEKKIYVTAAGSH